jgi:hydroxymethylbilane synthase
MEDEHIWLRGLVGALDGQQIIRGDVSGPKDQAEALGELLAEQLLAQGADAILHAVYNA